MKNSAAVAFTLVELLVGVAILAILIGIAVISYEPIIIKADGTKCLSHMRAIHTGLANYLHDKAHWPQQPEFEGETTVDEDWWINELSPYDVPANAWRCPAIVRLAKREDWKSLPKVHYLPGDFDDKMFSPYRFSTQPWLLEIASIHADGPNVCFPDGSIRGIYDIAPHLRKKKAQ